MITFSNVETHFSNKSIGPFNFRIKRGQTIAILGPSGVGKSTLIKLLSGEVQPRFGQIHLNGKHIKNWSLSELSQFRAVLPQSYEMAFDLDVALTVSLGRASRFDDIRSGLFVDEALACASAFHLKKRQFHSLSGGEKARVQLARVFCQLWDRRDGILLMDEPVASLDPGLQHQILKSAKQFCEARDLAMVAVLHDINQALIYFDQILAVYDQKNPKCMDANFKALQELEALYQTPLKILRDFSGKAYVFPR